MASERKLEGITTRHARGCAHKTGRCSCKPSYQGHVLVRGRRLRKTFATPAAARAWRQDLVVAVRRGETIAVPSRRTVADAVAEFTEALENGTALKRGGRTYKPAAARTYVRDLRGRVLDRIGHVRLSELERRHVQQLINDLGAEGLSASRVRGIVTAVQAMLRCEVQEQRIAASPCVELKLPPLPEADESVSTPEQTASLIEAAPDDDRVIWALAGWAGLRRGEIRALRVCDVDLDANVVRVTRAMDDSGEVVPPKSSRGRRNVPIAPQLRTVVLEHLARSGRRGDDLLCGRTASEPFTPTHVTARAWKAWAATAIGTFLRGESVAVELRPVGLHRFRHAWCSAMLAAGKPTATVALWAGHDERVLIERYHHAIPGRGVEDGETIGAVFPARQSRDNQQPTLAVVSGS